jgi:mono/diheme cytochrome c family protein
MRLALVLAPVLALALVAHGAAQQHQHEGGAHRHPEAAKLQNPVPADAASIEAGKKIYAKTCAECHGESGKGDGTMADEYTPRPPDLTDAEWKHGSTDGEIFVLIRDGSKGTAMKAYGSRMSPRDIWNVVNYLRSIGPAKSPIARAPLGGPSR